MNHHDRTSKILSSYRYSNKTISSSTNDKSTIQKSPENPVNTDPILSNLTCFDNKEEKII